MSIIKDIIFEDFQFAVEDAVRENNKNLLDTMSEFSRSASRLNRAVAYAATKCGCISINSEGRGISGRLCEKCRFSAEKELGELLFSAAALSSYLGMSMYDVMLTERRYIDLMGKYMPV